MLYLLRFDVGQPESWSQKQFYAMLAREADAAMQAVQAGLVKGIYKVVGQRVVLAIVDVPDHDALDAALEGLPIVREAGSNVDIEVLPIRPYENWAQFVKDAARA